MQQRHAIDGDTHREAFREPSSSDNRARSFLACSLSRLLFVGLSRAARNCLVLDHVDRRPRMRGDGFPAMLKCYLRHGAIEGQKCLLDDDVETAALLACRLDLESEAAPRRRT